MINARRRDFVSLKASIRGTVVGIITAPSDRNMNIDIPIPIGNQGSDGVSPGCGSESNGPGE